MPPFDRSPANPSPMDCDHAFLRMLAALPVAAYVCDADGLITNCNRAAVELWGREPRLNNPTERYSGALRLFSADGDLLKPAQCRMALAIAADSEFRGEEIIERTDGSRRTVLAHASPIHDEYGRLVGALNMLVDVTSQRQAEEARQKSESLLRTLFGATPDALVVLDGDGTVVSINAAGLDVCDAEGAGQVLGQPFDQFVTESFRDAFRDFVEQVADRERGTFEFHLAGASGNLRRIEVHATPLPMAGGEIRLLAVLRDVSELRRAEEALRRADRCKEEFLAMLAHELRNPLAPLRNAAVLLGTADLDGRSEEEAREILLRQVDHMARLLDDLLDASRVVQGKVALRHETVELAEVVRRAVEASQPRILQRGHEFTVSLPAGPVWLQADPVRLAQAFSNLLNNAAKFTPPGGRIRLSAACEADGIAVHVQDSGSGIESDLLPHVFDMFVQGETPIDRAQGGLGVGLTLVRSLVELHDGSVVVRSEGAGQGTEFVVRLPVLRECAFNPCDGPSQHAIRSLRVLVVEDNVGAARVLARLLEKFWDHKVRTAFHGLEAVAAVEEFLPDLVLCDIGLPYMDGYDVARRLRARPELRATLLVALTGYGTEEDRRRSAEAGFDLHLVKPAGVDTLRQLFGHPKLAEAPS